MATEPVNAEMTAPIDLRVDGFTAALGIDSRSPSLSWRLSFQGLQKAYQIIVSSTLIKCQSSEGDCWDSGRVDSDKSSFVKYAGLQLNAKAAMYWRVRVWDTNNLPSPWSEHTTFVMGLLAESDWAGAQWITATQACLDPAHPENPDGAAANKSQPIGIDAVRVPEKEINSQHVPSASILLRKKFTVRGNLSRAILYSTGLAHYEPTIDGETISSALLAPGWTNYRRTVLYDTIDVTSMLSAGDHEIRLLLGNGMYNVYYSPDRYVKFLNTFGAQKAIAHLHLEYADGTSETVVTDTSWQSATGPITYSNVFGGEDYDQRLEQPKQWEQAIPVKSPGGKLRGKSVSAPPILAIETLKNIRAVPHSDVTTIYDLGQNTAMMPRIVASGPAGSMIEIQPSELLGPNGEIDRASCVQDSGGPAYWKYTFDGRGPVTLFPRFFYQGGRYLHVDRVPAPNSNQLPTIEKLEGVVVHSTAEPVGSFECSNTLFNRIYQLVRWAQRSNMMHVMTDCPAREKLGWLEQLHLNGPSLRYNFRLDRFFHKSLNDISDSQEADGFVPNIAPEHFSADASLRRGPFRSSIEWGSSLIIAAWQQYLFHGDIDLLEAYYPTMVRYFDFLTQSMKDQLISNGLGDWYDIGPKPSWGSQLTPAPFTASAIYVYDAQILAKISKLVGKQVDEERFAQQASKTRDAINAHFQDEKSRMYVKGFPFPQGSQCATAMALAIGIAPEADRGILLEALVADIRAHQNGLTAGDVGYRFVLRALADAGRSDVIFDMNTNPERPGYAMQLARGATALTEKWDASVGSFGSQNHFMLGQINEWFFHDLAGIRPDESSPGFKSILIQPNPVGDVTSLKASYHTGYGEIKVEWKRSNSRFDLEVGVPPNSAAAIVMPAKTKGEPIIVGPGRHKLNCES